MPDAPVPPLAVPSPDAIAQMEVWLLQWAAQMPPHLQHLLLREITPHPTIQ